MEAHIKTQKEMNDEFREEIEACYNSPDNRSIADKRRAMVDFYSRVVAVDEETLCNRYRELKYAVDLGLSFMIGVPISIAMSCVISYLISASEHTDLLGFLEKFVIAAIFFAVFVRLLLMVKRTHLSDKVLLLYPMEMKLLENKLLQTDAYEITVKVLPDNPNIPKE